MSAVKKDLIECVEGFGDAYAFLFDMDGLIFDTERIFMEQLAVVMKEYGYTLTREIYCQTLGLGGSVLMELMKSHYGEEYPFRDISRETVRRVEMVSESIGLCVKPQIPEVLAYLKEKGIACAVASTTRSDTVRRYIEKAGLLSFFQKIIGGEMVEHSKPEPDIFLLAAKELGKEPKECVVLEDSENGVRAASQAGCHIICIPDLKQPSPEVLEKADYVIKRF